MSRLKIEVLSSSDKEEEDLDKLSRHKGWSSGDDSVPETVTSSSSRISSTDRDTIAKSFEASLRDYSMWLKSAVSSSIPNAGLDDSANFQAPISETDENDDKDFKDHVCPSCNKVVFKDFRRHKYLCFFCPHCKLWKRDKTQHFKRCSSEMFKEKQEKMAKDGSNRPCPFCNGKFVPKLKKHLQAIHHWKDSDLKRLNNKQKRGSEVDKWSHFELTDEQKQNIEKALSLRTKRLKLQRTAQESPAKKIEKKPVQQKPVQQKPVQLSPTNKAEKEPVPESPSLKVKKEAVQQIPTQQSPAKKAEKKPFQQIHAKKAEKEPFQQSPAKKFKEGDVQQKPIQQSPAKKVKTEPIQQKPVQQSPVKKLEKDNMEVKHAMLETAPANSDFNGEYSEKLKQMEHFVKELLSKSTDHSTMKNEKGRKGQRIIGKKEKNKTRSARYNAKIEKYLQDQIKLAIEKERAASNQILESFKEQVQMQAKQDRAAMINYILDFKLKLQSEQEALLKNERMYNRSYIYNMTNLEKQKLEFEAYKAESERKLKKEELRYLELSRYVSEIDALAGTSELVTGDDGMLQFVDLHDTPMKEDEGVN